MLNMQTSYILIFVATSCFITQVSPFTIPRSTSKSVVIHIVGGEPVIKNEVPYQIGLRRKGKHICGGAIIDSDHILTAAHCVEIGTTSDFSIAAGDRSLTVADGTEQFRNVSKVTIHEKYDSWTKANDIAVLKLSNPLILNDAVRAIPLPTEGFEGLSGTNGTISGWGFTNGEEGHIEDVLRKTTVPVLTDEECRGAYSKQDITDSMVCAGDLLEGGHDSCGGDDGGPLVINSKNSDGTLQYILLGLFSWTHTNCGSPSFPGVYTELAYFTSWIQKNTN